MWEHLNIELSIFALHSHCRRFIKGIIKSTTLVACLQNCRREFSDSDELTLKQFEEKCVDILTDLLEVPKGIE